MPEDRRQFLKVVGSVGVGGVVAGCGEPTTDGNDTDGENESEQTDMETPTESTDNDTDDTEDTEDTDDAEGASIRVAHLSPDAPNVDVYIDGNIAFEDVPFRTFSGYLDATAGEYDIEVTGAGNPDATVFDETVTLPEESVTAAALGEKADENEPFAVELFEDDRSDPGERARVQAIHASPDAPNVDITVEETGDVLFEDVPFGAADTVEVPAGAYTLAVRPATEGNDGDVVGRFNVDLEAGAVYTAAATGYLAPDDAPVNEPFDLTVVVDTGDDDAQMTEEVGFRVGHFAPDAPAVDVLVDGDPLVEGIANTEVSDYLNVAPDTYDVDVAASDDPDTVVFESAVTLERDTTAVAVGELAEENQPFTVKRLDDDLSDPGDRARVRLLHASPDAPAVDVTVAGSGDALFEDVQFGGTGTTEVPAGAYTLEVRPATDATDGDVVGTFDVQVEAGGVYTAVAAGYLTPEDAPTSEPFDLLVEVDRDPN